MSKSSAIQRIQKNIQYFCQWYPSIGRLASEHEIASACEQSLPRLSMKYYGFNLLEESIPYTNAGVNQLYSMIEQG